MNCGDLEELVNPYLDGVLEGGELEEFETHIKNCMRCRREVDSYRVLIGMLGELKEQDLPEGFHERLHERLLMEKRRSGKCFNWIRWFGLVAAALVLLIFARIIGTVVLTDNEALTQKSGTRMEKTTGEVGNGNAGIEAERFDAGGDIESEHEWSANGGMDFLKSKQVKLRIVDSDIDVQSIRVSMLRNGIEVLNMSDNYIVVKVDGVKEREILYDILSCYGTVEKIEDRDNSAKITVIIIEEE